MQKDPKSFELGLEIRLASPFISWVRLVILLNL